MTRNATDPKPPRKRPSRKADAVAPTDQSIWSQRREFANELFESMRRLHGQMFSPTVRREAKVVPVGGDAGSDVEIVEVRNEEPTFAEKQIIVRTIAVGIDKVLQLDAAGVAGTNVGRIEVLLASLREAEDGGVLSESDEALGQMALTLARSLDEAGGTASPATVRELREVLRQLGAEGGADDNGDWTAPPGTTAFRHPQRRVS